MAIASRRSCAGSCHQRAVPDDERTEQLSAKRARPEDRVARIVQVSRLSMFIHEDVHTAHARCSAGHGRRARAAVARRDGAGADARPRRPRPRPRSGSAASTSRTARSWIAWTPATEGAGFEFTPILKPLEPFRDSLVVVTNLTRPERAWTPIMPARRRRGWPAFRRSGPRVPITRWASRSTRSLRSRSGRRRRSRRSSSPRRTSAGWSATARPASAART